MKDLRQMKAFVPHLKNDTAPALLLPAASTLPMFSFTNDNLIFGGLQPSGLTNLPPFFTEEQNSTVLEIFLPRANKEVPFFVIEAEIEGLNLFNNKIQSLEEARLPNRTRFLFLDHNLIRKLPVFLLESLEFPDEGYAVQQSLACDCTALDLKKWVVSKSILVSIKTVYFPLEMKHSVLTLNVQLNVITQL
ncbi:hypothetical protein CEXT_312041 [Caerostris extrusa]|uniref:Uncharacterized protein n=1 Tax=Caerostris extrusa TaxID=172846 RepID=A0AAV4RDZ2_CAEEX|nr:hypothetical protein CEXT_312041 [Caerostris extrusa]